MIARENQRLTPQRRRGFSEPVPRHTPEFCGPDVYANMAMHLIEEALIGRAGGFVRVKANCVHPKFTPVPWKATAATPGRPG